LNLFFYIKFLVVLCSSVLFVSNAKARGDGLAETIQKIKPSIVAVGTFMPTRSPRASFRGTGFVVGDGSLIVTNAHVLPDSLNIEKLEKLAVFIRTGKQSQMTVVKELVVDTKHDIAILKLLKGRMPPLALGDASLVREGLSFAFTGYPIGMVLGLFPVTHQGIISAITPMAIPMLKSRQLNAKLMKRLREPYDVYQLDATAYPGNSGSPLYHIETGDVVGVINKVFVKESKETLLSRPSGITYAIPIQHVKQLLVSKGLQ
jgi:S1-C subfamily serine protease